MSTEKSPVNAPVSTVQPIAQIMEASGPKALFGTTSNEQGTGVIGTGAHGQMGLLGGTLLATGFGGGAADVPGGFGAGDPLNSVGVFGRSQNLGVYGFSDAPRNGVAILGNTNGGSGIGVHGHTSTGVGVLGTSNGSGPAGRFEGRLECTTTVTCFDVQLVGGDCAEQFVAADQAPLPSPGTVLVLDEQGAVRPSLEAYDPKVAGIVSGAGAYQPGILLSRDLGSSQCVPVALVGKVYCQVDAEYSPIAVGDLLTTSHTPGHAMKAIDRAQAFGAVIGKALRSLSSGRDLIPVLITLQ